MINFAISEAERQGVLKQLRLSEEKLQAASQELEQLLEALESEYCCISKELQNKLEEHTTSICSSMFKIRVQRCRLRGRQREIEAEKEEIS
jgi:predicted DNA-binding ArsR family transcriptional regulator